jgi:uncharacterized protein
LKIYLRKKKNQDLFAKVIAFKDKAKAFGFSLPRIKDYNNVLNSCYADKINQATINYNGDVYKCNARDFNEKNKEGVLTDDGQIAWNDRGKERVNIKMNNSPCLECSILPICGGGCSQVALENKDKDYCVHNFDESKKKMLCWKLFFSRKKKCNLYYNKLYRNNS